MLTFADGVEHTSTPQRCFHGHAQVVAAVLWNGGFNCFAAFCTRQDQLAHAGAITALAGNVVRGQTVLVANTHSGLVLQENRDAARVPTLCGDD